MPSLLNLPAGLVGQQLIDAARARTHAARDEVQDIMLRSVRERRDLTDAELRQVETLGAEVQLTEDLVARHAEGQADPDGLDHTRGSRPLGAGVGGYDSLVPGLLPDAGQLAEMIEHVRSGAPARRWNVRPAAPGGGTSLDGARAAVTTSGTGVATLHGGAHVLREPRRISVAASLPVEYVEGQAGEFGYITFGAGTAEIQTEGSAKQEYAAITNGTAVPAVIAVWTDFTRQVFTSVPAFEQRLRGKHAALVAKREDALMVARINAASGTQTHVAASSSVPYGDSLMVAAGKVLDSDVAAAPDLVLVNPTDLPALFPSDGQGVRGESPAQDFRLRLNGLDVYPTSAVTAGSAIVGAFGAGARLVIGQTPTVMIDAVSQLKANKITLLTEEAVTLAVDEPTAFVLVDLNGA